jgi:hypothetical protein
MDEMFNNMPTLGLRVLYAAACVIGCSTTRYEMNVKTQTAIQEEFVRMSSSSELDFEVRRRNCSNSSNSSYRSIVQCEKLLDFELLFHFHT